MPWIVEVSLELFSDSLIWGHARVQVNEYLSIETGEKGWTLVSDFIIYLLLPKFSRSRRYLVWTLIVFVFSNDKTIEVHFVVIMMFKSRRTVQLSDESAGKLRYRIFHLVLSMIWPFLCIYHTASMWNIYDRIFPVYSVVGASVLTPNFADDKVESY